VDGTFDTPAGASWQWTTANSLSVNLGSAADSTDDTCTATCHADGGNWQRKWNRAADSMRSTVGDVRCDVCHGDGSGTDTTWNTGVIDHVSDQEDADTTANEIIGNHTYGTVCGKCHGIGAPLAPQHLRVGHGP
jgi:cytochrome c5